MAGDRLTLGNMTHPLGLFAVALLIGLAVQQPVPQAGTTVPAPAITDERPAVLQPAGPRGPMGSHPVLGPVTPPVSGPLVRGFDPPARRWLPGHRGVDLGVLVDQAVVAPASGMVTFAGRIVDREVVVISHGALRTTLEPVVSEVAVGTLVSAGSVVGRVGTGNGHCPRTCLHWGLRQGDTYLNPMLTVLTTVRLLPTGSS